MSVPSVGSIETGQAFDGYLLPNERVLWMGRPARGLLITARDGLMIPFSLAWGGFALFWEASVVTTNAPVFFRLWGVPFVLIGLYLIVGRFAFDAWLRRRMVYAVTDRRVLIRRFAPLASFKALPLAQLPQARLRDEAGPRGTIVFGPEEAFYARHGGLGAWTPALEAMPQFLAIEDAKSVFNLVQRLQSRV